MFTLWAAANNNIKSRYNLFITIIFLLISLLSLSSCITRYFWDKKYEEIFHQFLVTKYGTQTVFIGEKYHYIFDDQSKLFTKLLLWNKRGTIYIDLSNSYLKVNADNSISGYVTIKNTYKTLTSREYNYLKSLGFTAPSYGNLEMKLNLKGQRFLPRKGVKFYTIKLSRQYIFDVHYEQTPFSKAVAIAVSPITVALDATLWIGDNILLAPFKN